MGMFLYFLSKDQVIFSIFKSAISEAIQELICIINNCFDNLNSILFHMFTENILDQTQPQKTEFTNCKIKYLLAQNKLMTVQLNSVCHLVDKYKKIIDILSKNTATNEQPKPEQIQQQNKENQSNLSQQKTMQQKVEQEIKKLLKDSESIINSCMAECKQISNAKNIFPQDQGTITPAFFSELVLSYEKTIAQLKQSIHQREILLQELQTTPNHPMKRVQEVPESGAIVKAIQSYDIYPRISEKCRKEILELKQKKKQLEMANCSKNVHKIKKVNGLNTFQEGDKTIKKVPQYANQNLSLNSQDKTQIQTENMSPFEKTILIYKKKKIFNDILQAKVIDLKKKIKQKQQCNQILRKRLENQVWQNIQNINHYGRNLEEDDPAYLSMLNQSIRANNLDFSVDISRVMGGMNQGKKEDPINLQNILKQVDKQ